MTIQFRDTFNKGSFMIIGICGLIGSGKGTVADFLVEQQGFTKLSFADKLKDGVASVFGWDREMLEGNTTGSREWREKVDPYWSTETGSPVTPRLVLQLFGTDCMRNGFYDGIWVSLVKKQLLDNPTGKFVIPDVRFENEANMIKSIGGELWRAKRGDDPEWWPIAQTQLRQQNQKKKTNSIVVAHKMEDQYPDVHISEWAWCNVDFDATIENNGTVEFLKNRVLNHLASK
jgi:hypothetical protein|tara:strand:+ start:8055 stop:8747 length:693 start_codon:yes stop_codon:yes gene_type:complete